MAETRRKERASKRPRGEFKHSPEEMQELKALDRMAAEMMGWTNVRDLGFDTVGDPPYASEGRLSRPIPRPSQQLDAMMRFARYIAQHKNIRAVSFSIDEGKDRVELFDIAEDSDALTGDTMQVTFCRLVRDTHIECGQPYNPRST